MTKTARSGAALAYPPSLPAALGGGSGNGAPHDGHPDTPRSCSRRLTFMITQEEHGCFSGRSQLAEARPEELCPHTRAQPGPAGDDRRLLAEEAEEPLLARLSGPPRDPQRTSRPRDAGGSRGPALGPTRPVLVSAAARSSAQSSGSSGPAAPSARHGQRAMAPAGPGPGSAPAGLGALRPRRRGCGCAAARKGKGEGGRGKRKGKGKAGSGIRRFLCWSVRGCPAGRRDPPACCKAWNMQNFLKKGCSSV